MKNIKVKIVLGLTVISVLGTGLYLQRPSYAEDIAVLEDTTEIELDDPEDEGDAFDDSDLLNQGINWPTNWEEEEDTEERFGIVDDYFLDDTTLVLVLDINRCTDCKVYYKEVNEKEYKFAGVADVEDDMLFQIPNLKKEKDYDIKTECKGESGKTYTGSMTAVSTYLDKNDAPISVTNIDYDIKTKKATVNIASNPLFDCLELKLGVYDSKESRQKLKTQTTDTLIFPISNGESYVLTAKAKQSLTNGTTETKWVDYDIFGQANVKSGKLTKKGLDLNWVKVAKAKEYQIYKSTDNKHFVLVDKVKGTKSSVKGIKKGDYITVRTKVGKEYSNIKYSWKVNGKSLEMVKVTKGSEFKK